MNNEFETTKYSGQTSWNWHCSNIRDKDECSNRKYSQNQCECVAIPSTQRKAQKSSKLEKMKGTGKNLLMNPAYIQNILNQKYLFEYDSETTNLSMHLSRQSTHFDRVTTTLLLHDTLLYDYSITVRWLDNFRWFVRSKQICRTFIPSFPQTN